MVVCTHISITVCKRIYGYVLGLINMVMCVDLCMWVEFVCAYVQEFVALCVYMGGNTHSAPCLYIYIFPHVSIRERKVFKYITNYKEQKK